MRGKNGVSKGLVDELDEPAIPPDIRDMTATTHVRATRKARVGAPRASGTAGRRLGRVEVPRGLSADEARRVLAAVASGAGAAARTGRTLTLRLEPATCKGATRFRIVKGFRTSKTKAASSLTEPEAVETELAPAVARAALNRAYTRGAAAAAEILAGSDMLSSDAIAQRLGLSREAVNQKRRRGELLGLEGVKRGVRFPAWQLGPDGLPLPALRDLYSALGAPWAVFRFLRQRHPELGMKTGLEAVSNPRRAAEALRLARSVGSFAPTGA